MIASALGLSSEQMGHTQMRVKEVHALSSNCDPRPQGGRERKRMKRTKTRVRFRDTDQVLGTVPNRRDASEAEILARWFRKAEYTDLIWESSVTLTMQKCEKKRHLVDDALLCCRGLLDRETLVTRQEERSLINSLVLHQLRSDHGKVNEETIAQLYHECSLPIVERAWDDALHDADDVKRYMRLDANCPPAENLGFHHTQEDNRVAIEELIMAELGKSDCHELTEQALKQALYRLNKRKRLDSEESRKELEQMILLEQLQQLADIYNDPSLTPEEKAAVEQATAALLQDSSGSNNEETCRRDPKHPTTKESPNLHGPVTVTG